MSISLTRLGDFSVIFFQIGFQFLSFPRTPNVGMLEVVPEASYTILILGCFFFFLFAVLIGCFCFLIFQIAVLILSLTPLLLISFKLFFIYVSVSFISDWFFFIDSMSIFMLLKF